ncbi:hypothetical protein FH972_001316 [Carpinus fangiana]|uniref:non-specific serine/threonine protein kinase n=1 Tax=Carpinus fangiana TaxID=176857 RepID=A0A5N6QBP7_9ROSI|nr:hypothetical protein FH972_001316 [Carpinus fangiana]
MTKLPFSSATVADTVTVVILVILAVTTSGHALGSGATLAVSFGSGTVCGIVASQPTQRIECYRRGQTIPIDPNINFSSITGGRNYFCGLRSGGYAFLCWDTTDFSSTNFAPKLVYSNYTVRLENLSYGDDQVCATVVGTGSVNCWRGRDNFQPPSGADGFVSISSGFGFSCGILANVSQVRCWGSNTTIGNLIQTGFGNMPMKSIVAGGSHVCGLNSTGFVICRGNNDSGQLDVPSSTEFSTLALGESHSCGIRRVNGSVACWGGGGEYSVNVTGVFFETIVSGSNFTCGLTSGNLSVICWGPGWPNSGGETGLHQVLPGPCNNQSCSECAKSDVYGLGVVLLELLTGKRAIFKSGDDRGTPISVVDFAVPIIMAGDLVKILDSRVGQPELHEVEAVELMAYSAMHCVHLEGKERLTMADIVANLDRALALFDDSHGSISSGIISIASE